MQLKIDNISPYLASYVLLLHNELIVSPHHVVAILLQPQYSSKAYVTLCGNILILFQGVTLGFSSLLWTTAWLMWCLEIRLVLSELQCLSNNKIRMSSSCRRHISELYNRANLMGTVWFWFRIYTKQIPRTDRKSKIKMTNIILELRFCFSGKIVFLPELACVVNGRWEPSLHSLTDRLLFEYQVNRFLRLCWRSISHCPLCLYLGNLSTHSVSCRSARHSCSFAPKSHIPNGTPSVWPRKFAARRFSRLS